METKFPRQQIFFASFKRLRDLKVLSDLVVSMSSFPTFILTLPFLLTKSLVDIAKKYPAATELNVLVLGMPNVGKSTLLSALRKVGVEGGTC